jgi:quercetin dioxygenase-like cupin family protein
MSNDLATSKIYILKDSIEYQEGAVVSKTILKKNTGTVTLFAFDENQGLSKHSTPFDAIVQMIEGAAEITIGETIFNLGAGDMIIMPANIPHALQGPGRFKMLLTMIKD